MIWTAVSGTVKLSGPEDSLTFCVLHECAILSGKEGIKRSYLTSYLEASLTDSLVFYAVRCLVGLAYTCLWTLGCPQSTSKARVKGCRRPGLPCRT